MIYLKQLIPISYKIHTNLMYYQNQHFSLHLAQHSKTVVLVMQIRDTQYYTDIFPQITGFLENHAPDVLKTTCYNSSNLTFPEEVINTEIGHFFEHLVLTYLYQEKIKTGRAASFKAVTEWNWQKYPSGSFKICINNKIERELLLKAIEKAIQTTELLFESRVIN